MADATVLAFFITSPLLQISFHLCNLIRNPFSIMSDQQWDFDHFSLDLPEDVRLVTILFEPQIPSNWDAPETRAKQVILQVGKNGHECYTKTALLQILVKLLLQCIVVLQRSTKAMSFLLLGKCLFQKVRY